ncbi:hypothetical protein ILUMI_24611 [Ignelater luminosus]|uniref:PiggyBac transposable element-derived protein domain-containing protein n=1 Tax=Ignelater luminosus TaxID=2038154 RepID=A0A8K0FYK9_IGNLU|nr:hypothetical protein ILUMI_24611 [Ignelater luminosus]
MDKLLDSGRILYTGNYYTSVSSASQLLQRQTHLVETVRSNRKLNSKSVVSKKLKRNEVFAEESGTGIVMLKWKDTRDVLMLTTQHNVDVVSIRQQDKEIDKSQAVVDYNKSKSYIDLSDQLKAYSHCLQRGTEWYRKLVVKLIFCSALVNSYLLYKSVTQNKMQITKYREELALVLLKEDKTGTNANKEVAREHTLVERRRKRCVGCYAKIKESEGRVAAQNECPRSVWIWIANTESFESVELKLNQIESLLSEFEEYQIEIEVSDSKEGTERALEVSSNELVSNVKLPSIPIPKFNDNWILFRDTFKELALLALPKVEQASVAELQKLKRINKNKNTSSVGEAGVISLVNSVIGKKDMRGVDVLFSTAVVEVLDINDDVYMCRILLDNGSQSNLTTKSLCDTLKLPMEDINILIIGINQVVSNIKRRCSVNICSRHNRFENSVYCLVIDEISETVSNHNLSISQLSIPGHIKLADLLFCKSGNIDLLLGVEIFYSLLCIDQISLDYDQPLLQKPVWMGDVRELGLNHLESNTNAAQTILHNLYVGNFLSGADVQAETIELCNEVKSILKSEFSELRKWISNDPQVIQHIPSDNIDFCKLQVDKKQLHKALGLMWECRADVLISAHNSKGSSCNTSPLSVTELDNVLTNLVRKVQQQEFGDIFNDLQSNKQIKAKAISKLCPFKLSRMGAVHPRPDKKPHLGTVKIPNCEIKRALSKVCPLPIEISVTKDKIQE